MTLEIDGIYEYRLTFIRGMRATCYFDDQGNILHWSVWENTLSKWLVRHAAL